MTLVIILFYNIPAWKQKSYRKWLGTSGKGFKTDTRIVSKETGPRIGLARMAKVLNDLILSKMD